MRFVSGVVAGFALALGGTSCAIVAGLAGDATLLPSDASTGGGQASSSSGAPPVCTRGDTMKCYGGPASTEGVGTCQGGMETCSQAGQWGMCAGEIEPQPRTCATTMDVACIGHDNCVVWAELFGDAKGSSVNAIAVDAMGNSYVVGSFSGVIALPAMNLTAVGTNDALLLKLDPGGAPIWGRSFGAPGAGALANAVAVDATGYVAIGGASSASLAFDSHAAGPGIYVARLDGGSGQVLWAQGLTVNYASPSFDVVDAIGCTSQGDMVIGGHFTSDLDLGGDMITGSHTLSTSYGFLGKLKAADGTSTTPDGWGRALCSGTYSCNVSSIAVAAVDTLLVAGEFQGVFNLAPGTFLGGQGKGGSFLGMLSSTGNFVWQQQVGGSGAGVQVSSLTAATDGGPILAGTFNTTVELDPGVMITPINSSSGFVVHYGPDQSYAWDMVLPNGYFLNVAADAAGDVVLAGTFDGPLSFGGSTIPLMSSGLGNLFVAKLSSARALLWAKSYGDGTWQPSFAGVALTPPGGPILVGNTQGAIDFGTLSLTPAAAEEAFVVELAP